MLQFLKKVAFVCSLFLTLDTYSNPGRYLIENKLSNGIKKTETISIYDEHFIVPHRSMNGISK